jgi:hypothetical protein
VIGGLVALRRRREPAPAGAAIPGARPDPDSASAEPETASAEPETAKADPESTTAEQEAEA